jgi:small subunit ribosomal protein S28e
MQSAEVVQIMETLGIKGVRRVRCRVIEGNDRNRLVTRNVSGPIKLGDVILIKDSGFDMESKMMQK